MVPFSIIFVGEFCVTIYSAYLNARFSLAHKTKIYDENCVIHDKRLELENYIGRYNE